MYSENINEYLWGARITFLNYFLFGPPKSLEENEGKSEIIEFFSSNNLKIRHLLSNDPEATDSCDYVDVDYIFFRWN